MELDQRTKSEFGATARRILEHARQAFNERGVASVGIREIARDLDLSPGNVSYHFPTKEALVVALVEKAHAQNNARAAPAGSLDFESLLAILHDIMRRDLDNRWLMRDCVGLLTTLPALRPLTEKMQRAREARVDGITRRLVAAGLLDRVRTEKQLPHLRRQVLTQVIFWLPMAILAAPDRDPEGSLETHARTVLALFLAYVTPTGRRRLESLLGRERA